jgi:putative hydrolase of HD superfamily
VSARKHKLEHYGIRYIETLLEPFNPILGAKIRAAWEEYEAGVTLEARWVREADKADCLIKAYDYELQTHGEKGLEEFQSLTSKITSQEGKAWLRLLQEERKAHFSRLKQRVPVIFVIGISCWPYFDFGSDSSSGAPGVGKKTQCALLSKEFGCRLISLDQVLHEKSHDPTYPHAQYVKDCLAEEDVDVATELAINLLGRKINEGNTWSLVLGFPERKEQLVEFEKKVSMTHEYKAMLMFVGSKDKLHNTAEVLSRANAPACRKAGTFRWSW